MAPGIAIAAVIALAVGQTTAEPASDDDKGWVRPRADTLRSVYSVQYKRDLSEFELFKTNQEEWTRPYISKDASRLFVGTRSGRIQALKTGTGELLWQRRDMGTIGASMIEHRSWILLGSDSDLVALDRASGETAWRLNIGGRIGGQVIIEKNLAIVPVRPNGFLGIVLSSTSAAEAWAVRRPTPDGITVRGQATPTIDQERKAAYLGFSDGALVSVNLEDGSLRWVQQLGLAREFFADIDAQPVLVDGGKAVLAASYNGGLARLDADNGGILYQKAELTRLTGLVQTSPGQVVATHGDGRVLGLYPATGAVRWRYRLRRGAPNVPLLLENGYVLVGCTEGPMAILKASNGAPVQLLDLSSGTSVPPFPRERHLVAMTNSGLLLGYRKGSALGRSR